MITSNTPPTVTAVQTPEPKVVPSKSIQQRLQDELPRRDGQFLRATFIANDCYRVNWYTPDNDPTCIAVTNRITSSKFLRVTQDENNKLAVEDKTIAVDKSSDILSMFL